MPFGTVIAPLGQTLMQHPQAAQSRVLTIAFLFAIKKSPSVDFYISIQEGAFFVP